MNPYKTKTNLAWVWSLPWSLRLFLIFLSGGWPFKAIITPIAHKLGMQNDFWRISDHFLAILCIIILVFVLGFISLLPSVSKYKEKMETCCLKIYPPLNYLKAMGMRKIKGRIRRRAGWKPVLALNV